MIQKRYHRFLDAAFWLCLISVAVYLVFFDGPKVLLAGDLSSIPKAVPIQQQGPLPSVTRVYYTHFSDFQRYSLNELFMEFAGSEPSGIVTGESDPMYVGGKSLMKTSQSGYMSYSRWKDIKPTGCWVQYNEIVRFPTTSGSAYPFMTWQGMVSNNESYPHITMVYSGGNIFINVRERSYSTPILSVNCGPKDTFPHKICVQWSSSWVIVQYDEIYQEVSVPSSWTDWPCNSSRFTLGTGVYLREHQMTLFGPQVTGISQ